MPILEQRLDIFARGRAANAPFQIHRPSLVRAGFSFSPDDAPNVVRD